MPHQKRRTNGQFAPTFAGKHAVPTPGAVIPRTLDKAELDRVSRRYIADQLGVAADSFELDKNGTFTIDGHRLRVVVAQMVPTDWGQAKGVRPHTVVTLRRAGRFQKNLTDHELHQLRDQLAH
jgi:hypothetical protein